MQGISHYLTLSPYDTESVELHYLTYGKPDRPAVLCVHSLTGNAEDFHYLATSLAQDFYVIAPTMPGRGKSGHYQDITLYQNTQYLSLCLDMLRVLNIHQCHWVGASMGGMMGMMASMVQPSLLSSLMLNDVGSIVAKEGLRHIYQAIHSPLPKNNKAAFEAVYKARYVKAFGMTEEEHWQHFWQSRVTYDANGMPSLIIDPDIYQSIEALAPNGESSIEDVDLTSLWETVHCPVLLYRGEHSDLLRQSTVDVMVASHDNITFHEWPHTGHMPHLMSDDQIHIIHNWLRSQS